MHFIHINIFRKKGYYESHGGDNTMPESLEKSGSATVIRGYILNRVFAWQAGSYDQNDDNKNGQW